MSDFLRGLAKEVRWCGVLLFCGLAFAARGATTYYVEPAPGGDDLDDGLTQATAKATLVNAIGLAITGDTIIMLDGTYMGAGNVNVSYGGKDLIIQSLNSNAVCIIDCQATASTRGFSFTGAETSAAVLDGVTIQNGRAPVVSLVAKGGAIFINGASPSIRNCVIKNSIAAGTAGSSNGEGYGGAVFAQDSSTTFTLCTFTNNLASGGSGGSFNPGREGWGGGLYATGTGTVTLSGCTFDSNNVTGGNSGTAGGIAHGGGVAGNSAVIFILNQCVLKKNTASSGATVVQQVGARGGAITCEGTNASTRLTMTDCEIGVGTGAGTGNNVVGSADGGGGLYFGGSGGGMTIQRCLFDKNTVAKENGGATCDGGGVFYASPGPAISTITNCTFSGNGATLGTTCEGAAVRVTAGSVALQYCTFTANTATKATVGAALRVNNGATATVIGSLFSGNTGAAGNSSSAGTLTSLGYNLGSDALSGMNVTTGDIRNNASANLGTLAFNGGAIPQLLTHALLAGSAAIDAAEPGPGAPATAATDQRGIARPLDGNGDTTGTADIGAFEATPPPTPSPTASPTATETASPTLSPTATETASPTATASATATASPTASPTASESPTATPTNTASPSPSDTESPTPSPTGSESASPTPSPTASPSPSPSASPSGSPSPVPTPDSNAAEKWEIYE